MPRICLPLLLQRQPLQFALQFALLLCCTAPAAAQVRLSSADCARVVAHIAEPSASYQPGADVLGRPVTPADLSPPAQVLPPTLGFVLSVELARRLNLPGALKGDLPLGIVTIENNQLLFNGRPIGGDAEAQLAAACAAARR